MKQTMNRLTKRICPIMVSRFSFMVSLIFSHSFLREFRFCTLRFTKFCAVRPITAFISARYPQSRWAARSFCQTIFASCAAWCVIFATAPPILLLRCICGRVYGKTRKKTSSRIRIIARSRSTLPCRMRWAC